jgi:carboxyl-terminal processing protease
MTVFFGSVRARRAFVLVFAAVAAAGCAATTGNLPGEQAPLEITRDALIQTDRYYLWPDRLDRRMIVGALDGFEASFDSVVFEAPDGAVEGILTVDGVSARVPLDTSFDPDTYREVLARAIHFTAENLKEPIDPNDDLEHIALRGALGALDRYTTVFSGRGSEDFKIRFEGKLSGIGARIGRRDGDLIAVRVFPGSPADRGGLKDGDAILFIDGDPTRPLSVEEAVGRIRGRAGTPVALGLQRGAENSEEKQRVDIQITRGEVVIPSVEGRVLDGGKRVGYVQIYQVSRETAQEFRARVEELGPLDGLVMDVRENTGGSMVAAAQLVDEFLDSQMIVRTVTRDGLPTDGRSRLAADSNVLFHMPLVILVDGQTASAAEIISGALQPLGNVTLVGQKTFGKGLVQQVMPMPDENLLKLTVAEYLLSDDRAINEKGIMPGIVLFPVPDTRLGVLANVPAGALPYVRVTGQEDTFPLDLSASLLRAPRETALSANRKIAYDAIAKQLAKHGVPWSSQRGPSDAPLPQPLVVKTEAPRFVSGEPGKIKIAVTNPNDFDLPDVWIALDAPAEYLDNKVAGLGALAAGATASAELELVPPDGISVARHPIDVLVAAGDRPLAKERVVLDVAAAPPELELELERLPSDEVKLVLRNKSLHAARSLTVAVPGATRSLESLDPGASQEYVLPLSAAPKTVIVAQLGPWAQRRIEVPIPESRSSYVPPKVSIEEHQSDVGLRASASEGIAHAWVAVDGQKKVYSRFGGANAAALDVALGPGQHDVASKVETTSGVSVVDLRRLTRD